MGRPHANANPVSTQQRILIAAQERFAEVGYGAKLSEIAAKAGIRRPSLLYHFGSKEVLYSAVITDAFARLGEALRTGQGVEGDFAVRLEQMTRAFVQFIDAHPAVARLIVRELVDGDGPGAAILLKGVAPLLDEIEQWIRTEGANDLRANVPVRPAMLQVVSDVLLRCSAGALRTPLWGDAGEQHTWWTARTLLMSDRGQNT